MVSYCAFLGHQPAISLAELHATLPGLKVKRKIGTLLLLFEVPEEIDPEILTTWGGTMLLAKEFPSPVTDGFREVPKQVADLSANVKGKVTFSLRCDGVDKNTVHRLYRDSKDALRKSGKAARYVGTDIKPAATVLLHELDLLSGKHGCEIVLIKRDDFVWAGQTVAAHDPNSYTKRDIEKPARDMRVGLLPPKLAQILLNFGLWLVESDKKKEETEKKKKKKDPLTVLDPFCGSGVILMEALLRGWPVLGSDVSLKSVNGTEKNLDWTRKEWEILKRDVPSTVWKQDAAKAFELRELPSMVVTETTLGESLIKKPTLKEISSHKSEAEKVECAFIENAAKSLPGVPLVCTFPVWVGSGDPVFLEKVWRVIADCGYEPVLPPGVSTDVAVHKSLLYRRPDQFVARQIVLLKPKK